MAPHRIVVPNGIEEIKARFGDPDGYLKPDGMLKSSWERDTIVRVALPYAIPYACAPATITRIACHHLLAEAMIVAFAALKEAGVAPEYLRYGGCFAARRARTAAKWSTHTWGIAIDLSPETNTLGTCGDMDRRVIDVFQAEGFTWGGDWGYSDPMHFQYATGY